MENGLISFEDCEYTPTTIRPVHVTCEEGVSSLERRAAVDGIEETLEIADVAQHLAPVYDFGILSPHKSVDSYLQEGREKSTRPNQLNAEEMLVQLREDGQYNAILLNSDIYKPGSNFLLGIGNENVGAIISSNRLQRLRLQEQDLYECFKTLTMHEIGHSFGLYHCDDVCVMRYGEPEDFIKYTNDRLNGKAFCEDCTGKLKEHFEKDLLSFE
jgi:predicted Zn-dependent protease